MAKRTWFYPEVRLLLGRERINVNSLEQAAQILMSDDWPLHDRTCEHAAEMLVKALLGDVEAADPAAGLVYRVVPGVTGRPAAAFVPDPAHRSSANARNAGPSTTRSVAARTTSTRAWQPAATPARYSAVPSNEPMSMKINS